MKKIWLCLLLSVPLLFEAKENYHHRLDAEVALVEKAKNQLEHFDKEMDDYLELRTNVLKEGETLLKKIGEWETLTKEEEAFKEAIERLRADFLTFRESLSHCIAQSDYYSSHGCTLRATSISTLTSWYVDYLEKMILSDREKMTLSEKKETAKN